MNHSFVFLTHQINAILERYTTTHDLQQFQNDFSDFIVRNNNVRNIGDILLNVGEQLIDTGNYDAGTYCIQTVYESDLSVLNSTLLYLRMAEYHLENGDREQGIAFLVKLCTETVSNYEESIAYNELTTVWNKYKHLVEGKVPPSETINGGSQPLRPDQCANTIEQIFALPTDDILSALSEHIGELSANGECLSCLNQWEKTVFYANECCEEINSGGFEHYLFYYGHRFGKARKAFETIQSNEMCSLMAAVEQKFPRQQIPKSIDSIQNAMDKLENVGVDFEQQNEAYYETVEKGMLEKLLEFVLHNKQHFR